MAMNFIGCAAHCCRRARSAIAGSIVGAAMLAAPAAFACAPADAALAGRYAAIDKSGKSNPQLQLQLNLDGSFRMHDVPPPGLEAAGCWQRSGDTVVLVEGLAIGGEGIKRALPEPLTQADLDKVRGNGIDTLQQAVDAGLLPLGRVWANQPRRAGETVRVSVYEPRVGLAVGEAKAMLRLADGEVIEQSPVPGDDGQFEFASLPKRAVVKAIGVRFPEQPNRIRWLSVEDSTKLLYLIEFDARALGAAEGGGMTLTRQADGSLISDFPDATHFKRLP
ncbi:hypothetical protein [Lysobacter capsici]|uniref:hypothetical protein n=2 Tax=Lysobacter capsici TaxID=435897 RepID=UPI00287BA100|nr:hypothetical protein [Lysobacter capsici]WND79540.1 hypothetical protein RJ610_19935 [Lysobacter capsici]WND84736.1 hypothetical protein RJ609_19950 [Lysobacter capsici]